MKKFVLTLAAMIMAAGIVSAQDLATATETYNNGAEQLSLGNKEAALSSFQEALAMGESLGDDAADLIANCKKVIPTVILSIGKELYNAKDFDGAAAKMSEAEAIAKDYGVEDVVEEVASILPQIKLNKAMTAANDAFKAKDLASAAEGYKEVLGLDPTNGAASLRVIQCLANLGDIDGAKSFLETAIANGQEDNAKKVLGGALLKKAAALLKEGKSADAITAAVEANGFAENAQAYLVAGQAASKLAKDSDAIKYYEQYLAAAPEAKNASAITFTVGALYQKLGNKAKAIENYKRVADDAKFGEQAKQMIAALSK
ncbi:MAG: tetratricopeptide repeat protein [Candidatus Cryptobacteroides sp.]